MDSTILNNLLISIIIFIIALQVFVTIKTVINITRFKSIFATYKDYNLRKVFLTKTEISDCDISQIEELVEQKNAEDNEGVKLEEDSLEVTLISSSKTKNLISHTIINSINMYLLKNTGSAIDYNLIKNIVDRNCESEEEVISVQQPIPLYLGLIGTMLGIIIGVGSLAGNDVFQNLENLKTEAIGHLMGGVASAMIASFIGITCTTGLSWYFKAAKSENEKNKNTFFSWIQAQLIPVISSSIGNSLFLLQQNLNVFNSKFSKNVDKMDKSLEKVSNSYSQQIQLISLIENLEVNKMAKANITVLKALNQSTDKIEKFNTYLIKVNEYVGKIDSLTEGINKHLDRTSMIEKMATFFDTEINQIESRKEAISSSVAQVDNSLKTALSDLKESAYNTMKELMTSSTEHQEKLKSTLNEQESELEKKLETSLSNQTKLLDNKNKQLDNFLSDIPKISELNNNMSAMNTEMEKLTTEATSQNKKLEQVISALSSLSKVIEERHNYQLSPQIQTKQDYPSMPIPKLNPLFMKTLIGVIASALLIIAILQSITFYKNF